MNMFGREFGNGLCFYQTRDGAASSGESGGSGSGSERSASPSMKRATRRFVLCPANLDAKESQGRVAPGNHLHQPGFVTYDMRRAVIHYASMTLKEQLSPPAELEHYLKVEVRELLGSFVFFCLTVYNFSRS